MALLTPLADSLVQPVISSVAKAICEKGVRRAERRYIDKKLLVPLHPSNNIKITNYFN